MFVRSSLKGSDLSSRCQETSGGRRAIDLAKEADQRGSHGKLVMNFLQTWEEMGGIFQWPEGKVSYFSVGER